MEYRGGGTHGGAWVSSFSFTQPSSTSIAYGDLLTLHSLIQDIDPSGVSWTLTTIGTLSGTFSQSSGSGNTANGVTFTVTSSGGSSGDIILTVISSNLYTYRVKYVVGEINSVH